MDFIFILFYAITFVIASYYVHILIHELGHLLFGWITGWKFLYLQVGNINIGRKKGRIKLFITKTKAYRCIMYPKELTQGAILYSAGGIILNGCMTAGSIIILSLLEHDSTQWVGLWCLFVMGLAFMIANAMPIVSWVISDGECIHILLRNEKSRLYHNAQFLIAKELAAGKTYHEIDESLFFLGDGDAEDDIQAYQKVLEYYYHLDKKELKLAHIAINGIKCWSRISKCVKNIIDAEGIYLAILEGYENVSYESRKQLETMAKDKKQIDIHIDRIILTYHSLRLRKVYESKIIVERIDRYMKEMQMKDYQYDGEKVFCINQLNNIKHLLP